MPKLPFWMTKLRQLWRLVRESHQNPLAGAPRVPQPVPPGETAVTFIGHSSFLLRTGGRALLVDPVFATRLILLRRQRRPGVLVRDLPPIDAVLLTHAHMDHLNRPSLRAVVRSMRRRGLPAPVAIVPDGVEDLVRDLGFREVRALRWWESTALSGPAASFLSSRTVSGAKGPASLSFRRLRAAKPEESAFQTAHTEAPITITATPAKHWGARLFNDTHRGFGGYVIASPGSPAIYHSGDTAYFSGFHEIGRRLRPEIALLPIGAYFPDSYRTVHTSPEEALRAFLDLGASTVVPMHYNTFRLGREPMTEPLPRLLAAADRARVVDRVHPLAEGETWVVSNSAETTASEDALIA